MGRLTTLWKNNVNFRISLVFLGWAVSNIAVWLISFYIAHRFGGKFHDYAEILWWLPVIFILIFAFIIDEAFETWPKKFTQPFIKKPWNLCYWIGISLILGTWALSIYLFNGDSGLIGWVKISGFLFGLPLWTVTWEGLRISVKAMLSKQIDPQVG